MNGCWGGFYQQEKRIKVHLKVQTFKPSFTFSKPIEWPGQVMPGQSCSPGLIFDTAVQGVRAQLKQLEQKQRKMSLLL